MQYIYVINLNYSNSLCSMFGKSLYCIRAIIVHLYNRELFLLINIIFYKLQENLLLVAQY
ncbi:hypothetical protein PFTANZ_00018 [Plasmodium falciparum Tanzania (2000708)]|uniref:Uncharacterized protein n=2 Tax=Plasmodium falciparum TaxID=5833 RepID=A0A024WFB0_PLAFA|nr:hypothetical protein PFTANZ_00018 [Plasmodium falciparum Tanzania (2000708)]ETW45492.1 hypothetical protein PFNF135_00014 [Plasmodium falciparum NF135/5.C10]